MASPTSRTSTITTRARVGEGGPLTERLRRQERRFGRRQRHRPSGQAAHGDGCDALHRGPRLTSGARAAAACVARRARDVGLAERTNFQVWQLVSLRSSLVLVCLVHSLGVQRRLSFGPDRLNRSKWATGLGGA